MDQVETVFSYERIRKLNIVDDDNLSVQVLINDIMYTVSKDVPIETTLNVFIREIANLKGTKAMCHEGGCGACIVAAEFQGSIKAVNSCLVPIFICDGWKITTIEGLGNGKVGYHTLQTALAEMNGSQCGYCSPGWVMNMYSLTQNGQMTMKEIENSFAGNICRCTGYRPILDTFKSFASDASPVMKKQIKDIEELYNIQPCKSCPKKTCNGTCKDMEIIYKSSIPRHLDIKFTNNVKFFKVLTINDIFTIFEKKNGKESYVIHGGNTAHGIFRLQRVNIYIDINDVSDLQKIVKEKNNLIIGANITISKVKICFENYMNERGFRYLKRMAKYINYIGSLPIRNIGTIAGNLMIKNQHPEFYSDIFLMLETAGAEIHILNSPREKNSMTLMEFLKVKMNKKLIYSIVLPSMTQEYTYKVYKIMSRAQNSSAIVNAGFLFKMDNNGIVLKKPNIIFGGINPNFLHASKTEAFLKGKSIYEVTVLQQALHTLNSELNPNYVLPASKPEYRKLLAISLLYKFVLGLNPNKVNLKLQSGATTLKRNLSSGRQDYDTDRKMWPFNMPISKVDSIHQTSGEAEYISDILIKDKNVFCAFTIADCPGKIEKVIYEEALNIVGVIAFYSAKDVPGKNLFNNSANNFLFCFNDEELFAEKEIKFAGQPFGIIVAMTQKQAQYAASKVKIIYSRGPKQKPMITIHDVLDSNDKTRIMKSIEIPASEPAGKDIKYNIKGSFECGSQYHFHMETQSCVCVPVEDGIDVFAGTHWMDHIQNNIATLLDLPPNRINVKVRRLGGSYGGKLTRGGLIACACALVCYKLNRPTCLVLSIEDNMRIVGKRTPHYIEYDINVNDSGKIQKLDATFYSNAGSTFNDPCGFLLGHHFSNCYDRSTWSITGYDVLTDLPSNTWCRAPGSTEGIAAIETIIERISRVTKKDPLEVRFVNMNEMDKQALPNMIDELKKTSDYENRRKDIEKFNNENRWKKRGISLIPMKYPLGLFSQYHSMVSIQARGGTVSVTQGGIEMGQGLHTKIAQIAAHTLGVKLEMVNVKPCNNFTSVNDLITGGSIATDTCGYATQEACKILLKRLEPIKEKLGGNPSWEELIFTAYQNNIDLCASSMFAVNSENPSLYFIYGTVVSEVEIDVLTGQHLIHRVDILQDTGISVNPKIDVGQVEGAFIMGVGYWTSEILIYDPETGNLKNYRTWNYKVPGAKDIPVDFRISFVRKTTQPVGILGSKAVSEPPLCLSCSIPIAIRQALDSARADAGNTDLWYQLDNSFTSEKILLSSLTHINSMVL